MLEPRDGAVVLRADCATIEVVRGAGILVETHCEGTVEGGAAEARGLLPRRWRMAGESWADCAARAMRVLFGLTASQVQEPAAWQPWASARSVKVRIRKVRTSESRCPGNSTWPYRCL